MKSIRSGYLERRDEQLPVVFIESGGREVSYTQNSMLFWWFQLSRRRKPRQEKKRKKKHIQNPKPRERNQKGKQNKKKKRCKTKRRKPSPLTQHNPSRSKRIGTSNLPLFHKRPIANQIPKYKRRYPSTTPPPPLVHPHQLHLKAKSHTPPNHPNTHNPNSSIPRPDATIKDVPPPTGVP